MRERERGNKRDKQFEIVLMKTTDISTRKSN